MTDPMPLDEPISEPSGDVATMPERTVDENDADKGRPNQRDKLIACASAWATGSATVPSTSWWR